MGMNDRLFQIEGAIEKALKESLGHLDLPDLPLEKFAHQFAKEAMGAARVDSIGREFAPDQFTLSVHPEAKRQIGQLSDDLQMNIARYFRQALQQAGFLFVRDVHFTLATDPTLPEDGVRVIGWHSSNPLDVQGEITPIEEYDTDVPPSGAFLVVEGKRHFQLSALLIKIGRRLDNDLVVDDPRVSRQHVHLLANRGKYILHDLNSTAGTYVNGIRVKEHSLKPGDVINIATVELIYGEDTGGPPEVTPPYKPVPSAEPEDDRVTPLNLKTTKQLKKLNSGSPGENE
jgi:hypothetical protein